MFSGRSPYFEIGVIHARRPDSRISGSGRERTASANENSAVFAPIPIASVATATIVNPGARTNWRMAYLRSDMTSPPLRRSIRRAAR